MFLKAFTTTFIITVKDNLYHHEHIIIALHDIFGKLKFSHNQLIKSFDGINFHEHILQCSATYSVMDV